MPGIPCAASAVAAMACSGGEVRRRCRRTVGAGTGGGAEARAGVSYSRRRIRSHGVSRKTVMRFQKGVLINFGSLVVFIESVFALSSCMRNMNRRGLLNQGKTLAASDRQ